MQIQIGSLDLQKIVHISHMDGSTMLCLVAKDSANIAQYVGTEVVLSVSLLLNRAWKTDQWN